MQYEVVSPVGEPVIETRQVPRSLGTLDGKTVCEIWRGEFRGHITCPIIREMLQKQYPNVKVIPYTEFPITHLNEMTVKEAKETLEAVRINLKEKGCDAVIAGQGG